MILARSVWSAAPFGLSRSGPLLASLLVGATALLPAQEPTNVTGEADAWCSSYATALRQVLSARRPLLLYFPSPRTGKEPAGVTRLGEQPGRAAPVVGLRVSSDEILELKERFRVARLPAVLFLDRRENVAARWEGSVPQDLPAQAQALARKLARREAEDLRTLEDAERLEAGGDVGAAYARGEPVWRSHTASPETLEAARRLRARLVESQRRALRAALGTEGLEADDSLLKRLEVLRRRTPDATVRAELELEAQRLRGTSIGGA